MAIKGKKKSQNRGSQARRRPAMAPRPATGKTRKPPWYKTTAGQTLAAITAMLVLLAILISVNNARTASQEREATERSFKAYTDQVRGVLESITAPATEMAAATQTPPDDLDAKAKGWSEDLVGAQAQAAQLSPPEGASSASRELFAQSMNLFKTAADTFATAAGLEGQQRSALLGAAAAQVASASQVWDAAVTVLDDARDASDLSPSGLGSPIAPPPSAAETPSAQVTVPAEGDTGDGDGGGKGRGGKGGGSKQDDDSGG